MRNSFSSIKNKILSRSASSDESLYQTKTADINVLLNRVKLDKIKEGRKKILFTAAASASVVLFGFLVF
mgnify:FL=1|tara:strand:+ start:258 stop:464 length:207 start_codon:yes stop_codon:yes gene_type:complete